MKKKKTIQFLSGKSIHDNMEQSASVIRKDKPNENLSANEEINDFFSSLKSKDHSIDTGKDFESFYQKIEFVDKTTIKSHYKRNTGKVLIRVAAVLLPLAILASLTFYYLKDKNEVKYEVLSTLKGSKTKVVLEDGTQIWLNAESELKYPSTFKGKDKRVVNLKGEAYFDVTKNKKKPFEVYAAGYKFKVLGTAFNIKAYPGEGKMQTTLEHGKVNVEKIISEDKNESRKIVSLKPKQTIVIFNNGLDAEYSTTDKNKNDSLNSVSTIKLNKASKNEKALLIDNSDLSPYLSWKDNKLIFNDVCVGEMIHDLERWYNINVVIADDSIKNIKFTATFTTETTEQAVKAISLAANIDYVIDNNTVIFKD